MSPGGIDDPSLGHLGEPCQEGLLALEVEIREPAQGGGDRGLVDVVRVHARPKIGAETAADPAAHPSIEVTDELVQGLAVPPADPHEQCLEAVGFHGRAILPGAATPGPAGFRYASSSPLRSPS